MELLFYHAQIVTETKTIPLGYLAVKDGRIAASGTAQELIAASRLKVWGCTVPKDKTERYLKAFRVANVKTVPGGAELRILSPTPPTENAREEMATLEDVFLHYFGERGSEDDGEV